MNKKLVLALGKRKLFRRAGGGLYIPKDIITRRSSAYSASNNMAIVPKQNYKKLSNNLKNLSIKPLKFKF